MAQLRADAVERAHQFVDAGRLADRRVRRDISLACRSVLTEATAICRLLSVIDQRYRDGAWNGCRSGSTGYDPVSAKRSPPILHEHKTAGYEMETVQKAADRQPDARRVGTYSAAALFLQIAFLSVFVVRYYVWHDKHSPMVGSDFAIFWAAARVALEHGAAAVFSPQWMQPIEAALRPVDGFAPWPYPPTFLLVVLPFGLISFVPSLVLFGMLQISCYAAVIARLTRPLDMQLRMAIAAFPGLIGAALTMQNSFITAAAAAGALILLDASPVGAGACVAILIIKPQFGILFPIAFICGRHWKALISAGVFSAGIIGLSVAAFGVGMWAAFFEFLPRFNRAVIEYGISFWSNMPSTFALARLAGLPINVAYIVQACIAVFGIAALVYVWTQRPRIELRGAALCAASLLVQSYFMYYDLLWLVLPIAFLLLDSRHAKLQRHEIVAIGFAWLVPAQAFVTMLAGVGRSFAPIVLLALLAIVVRRTRVMHRHTSIAGRS